MVLVTSRRQFGWQLVSVAVMTLVLAACGQKELPTPTEASGWPTAMVYKSPTCGCCTKWIDHLRENGFEVQIREPADMDAVKDRLEVPTDMRSCHTAVIGGYVVEGHVPATDIKRLLRDRPKAKGLAVPGMPLGSPGMEAGSRQQAYTVWLLNQGGNVSFADYPAQNLD